MTHAEEVALWRATLELRDAVERLWKADSEDDHFYGAWIGGSAASGGHPKGKPRSASTEDKHPSASRGLDDCRTVGDLQEYAKGKYGYADFTGIREEDAPVLKRCIAEVDRMAAEFPETLVNQSTEGGRTWQFTGIGTTSSPDCPRNVKELMEGAWGATKGLSQHGGVRIWLATDDPALFPEGTGVLGDIGFTVARTPEEAMVHEYGHVIHQTQRHSLQSVSSAVWKTYENSAHPGRQVLRDTSIYAGQNEEERYAELVTILHAPGGLDRLSKAARGRILRVQSLANEYQAAGHGNPAL